MGSLKKKMMGYGMIAMGLVVFAAGIAVEVAWLAFCFGSVIVGLLLLFLAPLLLMGPFFFFSCIGWVLIAGGAKLLE